MQIPANHAPLFTTCHVGLHVDSSSPDFYLGLLGLQPPSVKRT